jgi:hypothetical protein
MIPTLNLKEQNNYFLCWFVATAGHIHSYVHLGLWRDPPYSNNAKKQKFMTAAIIIITICFWNTMPCNEIVAVEKEFD